MSFGMSLSITAGQLAAALKTVRKAAGSNRHVPIPILQQVLLKEGVLVAQEEMTEAQRMARWEAC